MIVSSNAIKIDKIYDLTDLLNLRSTNVYRPTYEGYWHKTNSITHPWISNIV